MGTPFRQRPFGRRSLRDMMSANHKAIAERASCFPDAGIYIDGISVFNSKEVEPPQECNPGDADVDDDGLSLLPANWTGPQDSAVPEPMTIVLLVGALPVLRWSRR